MSTTNADLELGVGKGRVLGDRALEPAFCAKFGHLELDRDRHIYKLDGQVIMSNTDVLQTERFIDYDGVPQQNLEAAAIVGKAVHEATLLLDTGRKWRQKFGWVEGYVEGWKKFKRDFEFKPKIREQPMTSIYRIGTTPDAWGPSNRGEITVQIKTCEVKDAVGLQLAYEEFCINANDAFFSPRLTLDSTPDRWGIELTSDGDYKPRQFNDPNNVNDLRVFLAASTVAQWRRVHS